MPLPENINNHHNYPEIEVDLRAGAEVCGTAIGADPLDIEALNLPATAVLEHSIACLQNQMEELLNSPDLNETTFNHCLKVERRAHFLQGLNHFNLGREHPYATAGALLSWVKKLLPMTTRNGWA